jgi:hypothetical protein
MGSCTGRDLCDKLTGDASSAEHPRLPSASHSSAIVTADHVNGPTKIGHRELG